MSKVKENPCDHVILQSIQDAISLVYSTLYNDQQFHHLLVSYPVQQVSIDCAQMSQERHTLLCPSEDTRLD